MPKALSMQAGTSRFAIIRAVSICYVQPEQSTSSLKRYPSSFSTTSDALSQLSATQNQQIINSTAKRWPKPYPPTPSQIGNTTIKIKSHTQQKPQTRRSQAHIRMRHTTHGPLQVSTPTSAQNCLVQHRYTSNSYKN